MLSWFKDFTRIASIFKKRLVKSPKVYLRDSGILHYLNDVADETALHNYFMTGASWEGFAIEQIRRKGGDCFQYFFYRTHQGTECNLILERSGKVVAAIEIKYTISPAFTKSMAISMEDLNSQQGFVIMPEGDEFPLSKNVKAVSLEAFLKSYLDNI